MAGKLNLNVVPKTAPGPEYAEEQTYGVGSNTELMITHNHDGVNGGAQVDLAQQEMGGDLNIDGYNVINAKAFRGQVNPLDLTGISDLNELYNVAGDWYAKDGNGNTIRITQNGALAVGSFPGLLKLNVTNVTGNYVITVNDTTQAFDVDSTSGAIAITLPIAAAVGSGRFYYFYDVGGMAATHHITIQIAGGSGNSITSQADGGDTEFIMGGTFQSCLMWTDGAANWWVSIFNQYSYSSGQNVTFSPGATLQVLGTAEVNGTLNLSSGTILGTGVQMNANLNINSGLIDSNVAGGIQTSTPGGIQSYTGSGIQSQVAGGIVCNGGSTDYIALNPARTRTITYSTAQFLGLGLATGWTLDNYWIQGPGNSGSGCTICLPIQHNGATLASVNVLIELNGAPRTVPGTLPTVSILATHTIAGGSTGSPLFLSSTHTQSIPSSFYAGTTAIQVFTYTCDQNNVIDSSQYIYYMILTDEAGTSSVTLNNYIGFQLNYTNIINMQFP